MATIRSSGLILAFMVGTTGAKGQSVPSPAARLLRPGVDTLHIVVAMQGQTRVSGMVVDRLDTTGISGERVIHRIYTTTDAVLGNRVDTLIDHFETLRPRVVRSRSGQGAELLDWRDGRVRGSVSDPGQPARNVDVEMRENVYAAGTVDLVLRSSPLAEGYAVRIDAYSGLQGAVQVTARVVGTESVNGVGEVWHSRRLGTARPAPSATHARRHLTRRC